MRLARICVYVFAYNLAPGSFAILGGTLNAWCAGAAAPAAAVPVALGMMAQGLELVLLDTVREGGSEGARERGREGERGRGRERERIE